MLIEVIIDTALDSIKLLPFLYITYLLIELIEHKVGEAGRARIGAAKKSGPIWGALFGIIPQCGFSAAASSLYAGRIITIGTLMAVYLSTSDEMLRILISSSVGIRDCRKSAEDKNHHHNHEAEQGCEQRLALAAHRHTMEVFIYIAGISFLLNLGIAAIGEETLAGFFTSIPVLGEFLAALVGLIPNCASSVVITELYLSGVIGAGAMMSGLLVNAGVGILVLLRIDHDRKETAKIVAALYALGVSWGLVIHVLGVVF